MKHFKKRSVRKYRSTKSMKKHSKRSNRRRSNRRRSNRRRSNKRRSNKRRSNKRRSNKRRFGSCATSFPNSVGAAYYGSMEPFNIQTEGLIAVQPTNPSSYVIPELYNLKN